MKKIFGGMLFLIGIICLSVVIAIADGAYIPSHLMEMVFLMFLISFISFMVATYPGFYE